jgi:hypothetical protein
MTVPEDLVEVQLLQVPIPLWSKAQQLTDELLREFALASAQADDGDEHHLPARLTRLIHHLNARFAGSSTAQEEELHAAAAAGQAVLERLVFTVPDAAAPASLELAAMLDEADEYCRQGQHLLTLAAPDDVVAFRRWYLGEFIRQPSGAAPKPWPEYDGTWPPA